MECRRDRETERQRDRERERVTETQREREKDIEKKMGDLEHHSRSASIDDT